MKIGIFGGTFDPIHNAHITIAKYAKKEYMLDKLIIMPCGNPPHKATITDKYIRYEMAKLASDGDFEVNDFEIKREEYSYTLSTLIHFKEKYPDDKLYLIIGEDSLSDINSWYKPYEIIKLCTLLVFPRKDMSSLENEISKIQEQLGGVIFPINAPVMNKSSTNIRKRIQMGQNISDVVPKNVVKYIEDNNVYTNRN